MSSKTVLFVGLTCVDIVSVCHSYPLEDSDQRVISQRWQRGGNASNNSTVFSKLIQAFQLHSSASVEFFGSFADDQPSNFLLSDFEKCKIIVNKSETINCQQTPCSCVLINSQNGSRTILFAYKNYEEPSFESFSKLNVHKYSWIHFEGRNVDQVMKMLRFVRENDSKRAIKVSIELEAKECLKSFLYEDFDYFFIGKEFSSRFGYVNLDEAIDQFSKMLPKEKIIVCLWGESGVKAKNDDNRVHCSPIYRLKSGRIVDTLGAGDTCIASIIFATLMLKLDLQESVKFGCKVAAAKCSMEGFDGIDKFEQLVEQ